ncbi:hypothetical protein [Cutibacterium sp.]|uniref:hypothetical protein n=1 Tax=Cutibacterium sp. TaxID=1912221 RepID=UPI0026DC0DFD|nr:hypothetical protein [Cutibacterium sp.]MDO4412530.1 hypothetical protein [Cutibacterium sp.]
MSLMAGGLFEEARRLGMVKVTIDHPLARPDRCETEVVKAFWPQTDGVLLAPASG